jgi:hypothetical protein
MRRLRRQGGDAHVSKLDQYANRAFAISGRQDAMNLDPIESKTAAPEQTADDIIAECGGDPRAAVVELLAIIRSLIHETEALRRAVSPGFARRPPKRSPASPR